MKSPNFYDRCHPVEPQRLEGRNFGAEISRDRQLPQEKLVLKHFEVHIRTSSISQYGSRALLLPRATSRPQLSAPVFHLRFGGENVTGEERRRQVLQARRTVA
jgi:hypothetical protein